jgi:hypothetical protein
MDFIVGLPNIGNKSSIMVVVEFHSKYCHFRSLQHHLQASKIAHVLMDNGFELNGMSNSILLDCYPTFTNNCWQDLFKI